jgi:pyrimidine-nucleoside phosphorylase
LIAKKRDGGSFSADEIGALIEAFTEGRLPDYQMAAIAMAIYLRGMVADETAALTQSMLRTGRALEWPADRPPIVDKHSTGGIGDKVSLLLAPLLACCGVWVPMISGRGLGPTGGTLDKLEAIPGFRTDLSMDEVVSVTSEVGCVITGASDEIAPADRKLYALRDVTATVASIPLITASIMSKKLAESLDALVLDVKVGSGAFMKTIDEARTLANSLVATGNRVGVRTAALLTDMNQPLGRAFGNTVEVNETMAALQGGGPPDLTDVTLSLGAELLVQIGHAPSVENGVAQLQRQIDNGSSYGKFLEMVRAQGGDPDASRLRAPESHLSADRPGYIRAIDTERLGYAVIELGGGRRLVEDRIDHSVGCEMLVRIGDRVELGQPLIKVFAHAHQQDRIREFLGGAIQVTDEQPAPPPLILERIGVAINST